MKPELNSPLRPRAFAELLLASRDLRPRKRARDQRADVAGLDLKRRVLQGLADRDPEPAEMQATLVNLVADFGPPTGPTRAIAVSISLGLSFSKQRGHKLNVVHNQQPSCKQSGFSEFDRKRNRTRHERPKNTTRVHRARAR